MSRHFVIEMTVVLPGQDDEEEEDIAALTDRIAQLPEFHALNISIGEPRQI